MRYGFSRNFWPSVADNIRREVSCPVLAVPHAEVIPEREEKLKGWIDDWLAHQDASSLLARRGRHPSESGGDGRNR